MLRACFAPGSDGQRAWEEWSARVAFEDVDFASRGLLPLLYDRLSRQGIPSPCLAHYKGVYKHYWSAGLLRIQDARQALHVLQNAEIKLALFRDLGLVLGCGLSHALRPLHEIDLLVRADDFPRAAEILCDQTGWQPANRRGRSQLRRFARPGGRILNLHRRVLPWRIAPPEQLVRFCSACLANPLPAALNDRTVPVIPAAAQLMEVCAAAICDRGTALRRLADAALLVEHASIQWDFLVEQSQRLRITLPLVQCLHYLSSELDLRIPEQAFRALDRTPVPAVERFYCWLRTKLRSLRHGGLRSVIPS